MSSIEALAAAVRAGDRQALAKAITLVESRAPADHAAAEQLLALLLPHTGSALRVGITGAPGVGKSTLIETLGTRLCAAGHRVAVLAVDPSSAVTGGSILGDKTRMQALARLPGAFIRPTPGGEVLGGIATGTQPALLCCEAAGFDVVLVETIGTGQSETAVATLVDFYLLLLSPAAGDELQGIKRGVMELADGIAVHKADGDLQGAALAAAQQCLVALRVLRGADQAAFVLTVSSLTGDGVDALWQAIATRLAAARASGALQQRRRVQAGQSLDSALRELVLARFLADPLVQAALPQLRTDVAAGRLLPTAAARAVLALRGDAT